MRITIKFLLSSLLLSSILGSTNALAQSSDSTAPPSIENIVRVARSGGDFSNVNEAISSIGRATARNPVVVDIAPGIFNLSGPIVLQEYVHLRGAGKGITTLFGNIGGASSSDQAATMIRSSNSSTIHNISLANNSVGNTTIGINHGDSFSVCGSQGLSEPETIKNVSIRINGSANNKTGFKFQCGRVRIQETEIEILGGDRAIGIDASVSTLKLEDTNISIRYVENTTGVEAFNNLEMKNSSVRTTGKLSTQGRNTGLFVDQLTSFSQSQVVVSRGTVVTGISGGPIASMVIENDSTVSAGQGSVRSTAVSALDAGSITINNSRIGGGDASAEFAQAVGITGTGFKAFRSTFNFAPSLVDPGQCLQSFYRAPPFGGDLIVLPDDCLVE